MINEVGKSKKHKIKRPCQRDVVVDVDGEKYNVEIDCHYDEGVMKKNTHYLGRLYAEQEKQKNNQYESILPVNQMNIMVKGLNQGKVIDSYPRQNEEKRVVGKNTMRTYLLDVDFGNQKWYTGCRDKMINFCHLLMAENTSQIKEAIEGGIFSSMEFDMKILEAVEDATINGDDWEREEEMRVNTALKAAENYGRKKGLDEGRVEGREEGEAIGLEKGKAEGETIGLEKGKAQKQKEIAKAMLKENMDQSLIARITKLPLSQIMML